MNKKSYLIIWNDIWYKNDNKVTNFETIQNLI